MLKLHFVNSLQSANVFINQTTTPYKNHVTKVHIQQMFLLDPPCATGNFLKIAQVKTDKLLINR